MMRLRFWSLLSALPALSDSENKAILVASPQENICSVELIDPGWKELPTEWRPSLLSMLCQLERWV